MYRGKFGVDLNLAIQQTMKKSTNLIFPPKFSPRYNSVPTHKCYMLYQVPNYQTAKVKCSYNVPLWRQYNRNNSQIMNVYRTWNSIISISPQWHIVSIFDIGTISLKAAWLWGHKRLPIGIIKTWQFHFQCR